ncbi:HNH endonuclease [Epibacterium ulvae]|uniref:HNH endonuclease n=1 Tax=Epibacterium ulvae TaxID=1156985 RepID=UPI0034E20F27
MRRPCEVRRVYQDPRWRALKRAVRCRDKHVCQICGKLTHDPGGVWTDGQGQIRRRQDHPLFPQVDHIVPISKAPELVFDIDNLQLVHAHCHQTVKQKRDRSQRMQRDDGW